jgi:tetratricopeptide (TPR) repeat protein
MRAFFVRLALAALLLPVGCQTLHDKSPPAGSPSALKVDAVNLAEALAHYSQSLISESTPGGLEAGLRQLRMASESDPSYLPLSMKVAATYLARKEFDQALAVLQRAKTVHPDSADIRLLLGIVHQLKEAPGPAIREYEAAQRLAPDQADAYLRLATLYAAATRFSKTLSVIDVALRKVADQDTLIEFCENMGRLYLQGGQPRDALKLFERIQRRRPDDPLIKELIARCHAAVGDRKQALAELLELERTQPESRPRALLLGELYEDDGDFVRAEEYVSRVVRGAPHDVLTWLKLANIQFRTAPDRALQTLQEAVTNNPTDLSSRAFLGLLYSRNRQFDAAIGIFAEIEKSLSKESAVSMVLRPQFYFWYGSACEQAGKLEEAERLLEKCVAMDPESAQALNYLAYMWATKGTKLDRALEYVTRALEVEPDECAYLDTLGWVHYQRGDYREALKYLKKAYAGAPEEPVIAEHVGDAWAALNNRDEAVRFWRLSLKLDPRNAPLREKLVKMGIEPASLPAIPK